MQQHPTHVEQLTQIVHPDHPALGQQCPVGGRFGPCTFRWLASPSGWALVAGLDRSQRCGACHATGDAHELARVAKRLEIHQHHRCGVVMFPVLQHVVAAHVGLGSHVHERGDSQAPLVGEVERSHAEGARLGEQADRP